MILYVLKKNACSTKHVKILLSLFRKYQIRCQKIKYLELREKGKFFYPVSIQNNYQLPISKNKYQCVYFITDFSLCQYKPREIKEKFRKKFGYECLHASDDNQVGNIEIDNIEYPNNTIIYRMTHVERDKSLKEKGFFI